MFIRDYLTRASKGSVLPACIVQEGATARIKPSEAEEIAGQGACKSWKTTFRTMLNGKAVTLQDYLLTHQQVSK